MIELTLYQQQAWWGLVVYAWFGFCLCQSIKGNFDQKELEVVLERYGKFASGVTAITRQSVITCAARKMTSTNQNFGNEATDLLKKIVKFKWELE
jgi:hypothetical protein